MRKLNFNTFLIVLLALFILGFSGCKRRDVQVVAPPAAPTVNVHFNLVANGNPLVFNQTVANTNGQRYFINYLTFYAGNPRLVKTDGTEVSLKDIILVNFDDNINKDDPTHDPATVGTSFSFTTTAGTYTALRFTLGVPKNLEPAQTGKADVDYPVGSPLGFNRGMYWDMSATSYGVYRIAIITGDVDTAKVPSTPTDPFSYHTGYDSLNREVAFTDNFSIDKGQSHDITILLDADKIFNNSSYTTNLQTENYTHMSQGNIPEGLLGVKIMNSMVLALSKKQ